MKGKPKPVTALFLLGAAIALLAGCSSSSTADYKASAKSVISQSQLANQAQQSAIAINPNIPANAKQEIFGHAAAAANAPSTP